jgi:hypothetical protein
MHDEWMKEWMSGRQTDGLIAAKVISDHFLFVVSCVAFPFVTVTVTHEQHANTVMRSLFSALLIRSSLLAVSTTILHPTVSTIQFKLNPH